MVKKCGYKYKGKCFQTKYAKGRYKSWENIIKNATKDGVIKRDIKIIKKFQKSWVGK